MPPPLGTHSLAALDTQLSRHQMKTAEGPGGVLKASKHLAEDVWVIMMPGQLRGTFLSLLSFGLMHVCASLAHLLTQCIPAFV